MMHATTRRTGSVAGIPLEARRRPEALPENTELVFNVIVDEVPAVAALPTRARRVLKAIYGYVGHNAYGYPSQATIGRSAGYTSRTVRSALVDLRRARFVVTWIERRDDGTHGTLRYAWGPAAHEAFGHVARRYPRRPLEARAKPLPRQEMPPAPQIPACPPAEIRSSSPAEMGSTDPDQNSVNSFLCETTPEAVEAPEQKAEVLISSEDRATAREILTHYARRRHPKRSPPSSFDPDVVDLVALRAAQTEGDQPAKFEALRAAVVGAFVISRERPPTIRYVFGAQEHFLAHVDRGRAKAEGDARAARRRAEGASTTPRPTTTTASPPRPADTRTPEVMAWLATFLADEPPPPRLPTAAEVRAEVERDLAADRARRPPNLPLT